LKSTLLVYALYSDLSQYTPLHFGKAVKTRQFRHVSLYMGRYYFFFNIDMVANIALFAFTFAFSARMMMGFGCDLRRGIGKGKDTRPNIINKESGPDVLNE
jgi:hypothetical protein